MSSSSQPLTSTISDLFNFLQDVNSTNELQDPAPAIDVPPTQTQRAVSGKYKYEIHDSAGVVYDSGDWKPNLILNCGMDKVAEMPWAQVFQFAVAGTDPTPTRELFEDTDLTVKLLSSSKCPGGDLGTVCSPNKPVGGLIMRACTSRREAEDAAKAGSCLQKTFGESSDSGKLIYLRDRDLQYNVLSSCPVYSFEPKQPECYILGDACTGSLSAADIAGGNPGGIGGLTLNGGAGYMASLSADTGAPWNQGGLIIRYQNIGLSAGDCSVPVLCAYSNTHQLSGNSYINPAVGISIGRPQLSPPALVGRVGPGMNSLLPSDISILDPGTALGCNDLELQFGLPSSPAICRGPWFNRTSPTFSGPQSTDLPIGRWVKETHTI